MSRESIIAFNIYNNVSIFTKTADVTVVAIARLYVNLYLC